MAGTASAAVDLDFAGTVASSPGSSLNISATSVTGVAIPINMLTVSGDPPFNGSYTITGAGGVGNGRLDFACTVLPNCAPTNSFVIQGAITGGVGSPFGLTGLSFRTLLTGTFSTLTVTANTLIVGAVFGSGPDTKDPTLLADLGLSGAFTFAGFSSAANTATGTGSPYTNNFSSDIHNDPVPEPMSIMMLGTVLVGVARVIRRRPAKA